MLFIRLAWRNVLRNKRRSFIAGIAIGLGLASLIFVDALTIGMEQNMIASATSSFLGEAQIHAAGYRDTRHVDLTINRPEAVMNELSSDRRIAYAAPRVSFFGMLSSASNFTAVSGTGIDPAVERKLSVIDEAMIRGAYTDGEGDLVVGSELAEILDVGLGDRVVVTAAQADGGNLSQMLFRVTGIFSTHIKEMDLNMAFLHIRAAQQLLGLDQAVHEIAVRFEDPSIGQESGNPFYKEYSKNGNEAIGWVTLMPQIQAMFEMTGWSMLIVAIILFIIIALGIINTIFMSLYERMFEFGVLRSVGTRSIRIAALILLEAAALSVLSIGIGSIIGLLSVYIVSLTGINYTGIEFAGVTFRDLLYPVLHIKQFIIYPAGLFVCTILVAVYPAVFAARMNPVQAMRRSL